jgi:hypothetical protein
VAAARPRGRAGGGAPAGRLLLVRPPEGLNQPGGAQGSPLRRDHGLPVGCLSGDLAYHGGDHVAVAGGYWQERGGGSAAPCGGVARWWHPRQGGRTMTHIISHQGFIFTVLIILLHLARLLHIPLLLSSSWISTDFGSSSSVLYDHPSQSQSVRPEQRSTAVMEHREEGPTHHVLAMSHRGKSSR